VLPVLGATGLSGSQQQRKSKREDKKPRETHWSISPYLSWVTGLPDRARRVTPLLACDPLAGCTPRFAVLPRGLSPRHLGRVHWSNLSMSEHVAQPHTLIDTCRWSNPSICRDNTQPAGNRGHGSSIQNIVTSAVCPDDWIAVAC